MGHTAQNRSSDAQPAKKVDPELGEQIAKDHGLLGVYFRYPGAARMAANDLLLERGATFADQKKAMVEYLKSLNKRTDLRLEEIKRKGTNAGYYNLEVETIGHKTSSSSSHRGKK